MYPIFERICVCSVECSLAKILQMCYLKNGLKCTLNVRFPQQERLSVDQKIFILPVCTVYSSSLVHCSCSEYTMKIRPDFLDNPYIFDFLIFEENYAVSSGSIDFN